MKVRQKKEITRAKKASCEKRSVKKKWWTNAVMKTSLLMHSQQSAIARSRSFSTSHELGITRSDLPLFLFHYVRSFVLDIFPPKASTTPSSPVSIHVPNNAKRKPAEREKKLASSFYLAARLVNKAYDALSGTPPFSTLERDLSWRSPPPLLNESSGITSKGSGGVSRIWLYKAARCSFLRWLTKFPAESDKKRNDRPLQWHNK